MTDDPKHPAVADTLADADDTTTTRAARISAAALEDYVIGDVLGRGGMGEVVAAHDTRIEREVAIKRMREPHPDATPASSARPRSRAASIIPRSCRCTRSAPTRRGGRTSPWV